MPVYILCFAASFLAARTGRYLLSGTALLFSAGVLFLRDMRGQRPRRLRALYTAGFLGGQGLSALKLSYLQTDWEPLTWAVLFLSFAVFWLSYEFRFRRGTETRMDAGPAAGQERRFSSCRPDRLFLSVVGICAVSWTAFLMEVRLLGYVPLLLRGVPHAYSWFHISGLHYFTVSCALLPALSLVWFRIDPAAVFWKKAAVGFCVFSAFLIPVLCVSRSQMLLAALLAVFVYAAGTDFVSGRIADGITKRKLPLRTGAAALFLLTVVYVLLSIARSHSVAYLNGIFEMKGDYPIFVSQPYIYIANNYDNLNCLIRDLSRHTFGLRMLYPVWALTGLKFFFPQLISAPLYVTKTELTTLTLVYDAYYDFGTAGVTALTALLGTVSAGLDRHMQVPHNPLLAVFYAQLAAYLSLSFFTAWFSNPATWFYFAETLAVLLFCSLGTVYK